MLLVEQPCPNSSGPEVAAGNGGRLSLRLPAHWGVCSADTMVAWAPQTKHRLKKTRQLHIFDG